MNHPIDDIFKHGLGEASLEGHENDWLQAREMLGLKKKNRRFLWLWWAGILMLIVLAGGLSISQLSNPVQPGSESQQLRGSNEPAENKFAKSEFLAKSEDQGDDDQLRINLKNKTNTSSSSREANVSSTTKLGSSTLSPQFKTKSIRDQGSFETSQFTQSGKIANLSHEINVKTNHTLDTSSSGHSGNVELASSVMDQNNLNDAIQSARPGKDKPEESTSKEEILFNDASVLALSRLRHEIEPLEAPTNHPLIPFDKVRIDDSSENQSRIVPGIYISYNPVRSEIGSGLFLSSDLSSSWSIDVGIGFSRKSEMTSRTYQKVTFDTRAAAEGDITSRNEYAQYNLQIPIRAHYRYRKHSLFTGMIVERPLSLNGTQEVSVSQELDNADFPAQDPLAIPLAIEPYLVTQSYNINSVPERKQFIFHGLFGYSYRIIPQIELSLAGTYQFQKQQLISPLLRDDFDNSEKESSWSLLLRLNYNF